MINCRHFLLFLVILFSPGLKTAASGEESELITVRANKAEHGGIHLQLHGPIAQSFLVLESSSNLTSWQRAGPVSTPRGAGAISEAALASQQFFRAFRETPQSVIEYLHAQSRDLAQTWLDHRNGVQGIESVGGPFRLVDYTNKMTIFTNSGFLNISYQLEQLRDFVGRPWAFQTYTSEREASYTNDFPIHFGQMPPTELTDTDSKDVQRQIGEKTLFLATNVVMQVDDAGRVESSQRMFFLPMVSTRMTAGELVVETGRMDFHELRRRRIEMVKMGAAWEVSSAGREYMGDERLEGRAEGERLTVVVGGRLSETEITNIIERVEHSFGRLPAIVYIDRSSFGLYVEPDIKLTAPQRRWIFYRAEDRWVLRFNISLFHGETIGLAGPVLPLLPKPEAPAVDRLLAELGSADVRIPAPDLRYFVETTLRARGIGHRILNVRRRSADEVEVMTTSAIGGPVTFGGDMIFFLRVGTQWIIANVGRWVA